MATNWASLIPHIEAFFDSEEVKALEKATENLLINGSHSDPVVIAKLQARLLLLRQLRELPKVLAERDKKRADADEQADYMNQRAAGSRIAVLPRID